METLVLHKWNSLSIQGIRPVLMILLFLYPLANAYASEETGITHHSELIYRQASVQIRPDSVLYREERDRDFADQIYASLALRRTDQYVHQVHLEPAFFTRRDNPGTTEFRLDQAYVVAKLSDSLGLLAGKKVEYRGSGFVLNPSDLLHERKDIIDQLNQREGVVMTRLDWRPTSNWMLGLGFVREVNRDFADAKAWMLIQGTLLDGELIAQVTHQASEKSTVGASYSRFVTDDVEVHGEVKFQSRQRGIALQVERPFSAYEFEDSSLAFLLGTRVVLPARLSLVAEWYQNQSGLAAVETEAFFQHQVDEQQAGRSVADPLTRPIGRNYTFAAIIADQFSKRWRAMLSALTNLDDRSSFASISIKFLPTNIAELAYSPIFFMGEELTEFGEQPASALHYFSVSGRF